MDPVIRNIIITYVFFASYYFGVKYYKKFKLWDLEWRIKNEQTKTKTKRRKHSSYIMGK